MAGPSATGAWDPGSGRTDNNVRTVHQRRVEASDSNEKHSSGINYKNEAIRTFRLSDGLFYAQGRAGNFAAEAAPGPRGRIGERAFLYPIAQGQAVSFAAEAHVISSVSAKPSAVR